MQEHKRGREYSSKKNLVRVSPHDKRTVRYAETYGERKNRSGRNGKERKAGRGRKKDIRMIVMTAVTLILLLLSGKAVYGLFQAEKTPDITNVSDMDAQGKAGDESGPQGGTEAMPDEEEKVSSTKVLVAIDPGHGGIDNGSNIDGIYEQVINMEIALLLADKLEEMGIDVLLLREDNDTSLSLEERVEKAENAGADIFVSIHQNFYDGKDTSVSGMETWYCGKLEDSRRLASLVHEKAAERTGAKDRGLIESDELFVVRETSMPSCLMETGFLSNREERNALMTKEYQEKIAEGIAEGIGEYFQVGE